MGKSKSARPGEKAESLTDRLTLKDRLSALSNLPGFFRLVWETNPPIMIVNSILRIIRASTPVLILYVGKLIIDQVVMLSRGPHGHSTRPASLATRRHRIWTGYFVGYFD